MRSICIVVALSLLFCAAAAAQEETESESPFLQQAPGKALVSQEDDDRRVETTNPRCDRVLLGLCSTFRDRPVMTVATAQFGLSMADSIQTEIFKAKMQREGGQFLEVDPFARPFINHPGALYVFDSGGAIATAWLAHRMRHSSRRWERKLWWLPQSIVITGNTGGIIYSAIHER